MKPQRRHIDARCAAQCARRCNSPRAVRSWILGSLHFPCRHSQFECNACCLDDTPSSCGRASSTTTPAAIRECKCGETSHCLAITASAACVRPQISKLLRYQYMHQVRVSRTTTPTTTRQSHKYAHGALISASGSCWWRKQLPQQRPPDESLTHDTELFRARVVVGVNIFKFN